MPPSGWHVSLSVGTIFVIAMDVGGSFRLVTVPALGRQAWTVQERWLNGAWEQTSK